MELRNRLYSFSFNIAPCGVSYLEGQYPDPERNLTTQFCSFFSTSWYHDSFVSIPSQQTEPFQTTCSKAFCWWWITQLVPSLAGGEAS